jgi:hypothetical protein
LNSRHRRAIALFLGVGLAGCQIYLAGGPSSPPPREPARARPAQVDHRSEAATPWPETDADEIDDAPTPEPEVAPAPAATFPGERYFRAGGPRTLVRAAEDVLAARDYRVLRSGVAPRGGEVHGEHRAQTDAHPATTTSPAWQIRAGVIHIAGSNWDDCCYVTATFTTTRLNSRGHVLGTTAADEPENEILRSWFFDDLARYLRNTPAD